MYIKLKWRHVKLDESEYEDSIWWNLVSAQSCIRLIYSHWCVIVMNPRHRKVYIALSIAFCFAQFFSSSSVVVILCCGYILYCYESYCGLPRGLLAHTVSVTARESNEVIDCLKWSFSPFVHCLRRLCSVTKACLLAEIIYLYSSWGKWLDN